MQLDRDIEIADLFDVVAQADTAALDVVAEPLQRFGDVEHRHRAIKNPVLADAAFKAQLQTVELLGLALGAHLLALLALGQHAPLLFDHAAVAGARLNRQPLRQQVIAPVTGAHAHHLAALAEVVYVFFQQNIHVCH